VEEAEFSLGAHTIVFLAVIFAILDGITKYIERNYTREPEKFTGF
jgi:hypothetical protein